MPAPPEEPTVAVPVLKPADEVAADLCSTFEAAEQEGEGGPKC